MFTIVKELEIRCYAIATRILMRIVIFRLEEIKMTKRLHKCPTPIDVMYNSTLTDVGQNCRFPDEKNR